MSAQSDVRIRGLLVAGRATIRQSRPAHLPNLARWAWGARHRPPLANESDTEFTDETRSKEIAMRSTSSQPNPVARDIQNVVSDAQDLLKTVQDTGADKMGEMRAKMQTQIDAARQTLTELQQSVQDGAKVAINTTDEYVRSNPWRAVGISAGIGALVGFLIARR
jgi:ElaB/YqjD/DUF883 family membrane-anchored ribosome-binding protein